MTLLTGCAIDYIQVFQTTSTNTAISEKDNVFENDTVKISYSFWAPQGVMSFSIYNKLNKPIYVDWKNSSYIVNEKKLNYWIDETQTNQVAYYDTYFYNGPFLPQGFGVSSGVMKSSSSSLKPERVTFIPPKSYSTKTQFYLLPVKSFKFSKNCVKSVEQRNDRPGKKTKVYSETFTNTNSLLRFRNFIAISFNENSTDFYFVDNIFFLSSAKEMDYRHFRGKYLGKSEDGNDIFKKPFKNNESFYIDTEWRTVTN